MVISETSFDHDACNNFTMVVRDFADISYSRVVLYIGSRRLGISCPIISPQNQLDIYLVTSRQYRLGIAKLKNVFRSFLTHSKKL